MSVEAGFTGMANVASWAIVDSGHGAQSSRAEGRKLGPRQALVVAEALADPFSRAILASSVSRGKTVEEICYEQGIPQSSCYRRMRRLLAEGVVVVERTMMAPTGRKCAVYRSVFSRMEVSLEGGVVSAYALMNPDVAEKLGRTRGWPEPFFSPHEQLSAFVMPSGGSPRPVAASP
jgi:predicted transcriptional regulator